MVHTAMGKPCSGELASFITARPRRGAARVERGPRSQVAYICSDKGEGEGERRVR